jgi:hypothetical protein
MAIAIPSLRLRRLTFTGPSAQEAAVKFSDGLTVLYGASNTGKSFAVKSINFLLGGAQPLPSIGERVGYDRGWLSLDLPISQRVTLMRALAGGSFELHHGEVANNADGQPVLLSARHDPSDTDNVSQYLLTEIGLVGKKIALDPNGKVRSLSFRDLARFCIIDETAIQSETSPVESGQNQLAVQERSVFKLLITGADDSAVVPVVDRRTFKASTSGKLEVVNDLIAALDEELASDFPDQQDLAAQNQRLEETWQGAQRELQLAQASIRNLLAEKRSLAERIFAYGNRREEIQVNIGRFEQLQDVYVSDIERLEAIEEAGFLLSLGGDKPCPLCGALPAFQRAAHGTDQVQEAQAAAGAEIGKIRLQATDLLLALADLDNEGLRVEQALADAYQRLGTIEAELAELAPTSGEAKRRVDEVLPVRDRIRKGLSLLEQRASLQQRRDELAALKPASKGERPALGLAPGEAHGFAQKVSEVLAAWHFPGSHHVAFDEQTYDLRIDGKMRRDNGKGVRAVTHAAFKVALLLYCREHKLPHPGFLLLDTPLLTYRDPLRSRAGDLASDEAALKATSLKDHFFGHLAASASEGQFIVVENVDLPADIAHTALVETFAGDVTSGRAGLFLPTS